MTEVSSQPVTVRTVRIIWLALLLSVLIYGVLGVIGVQEPTDASFESAFSNPVVIGLHVAGLGAFFMAFVMSSLLLRRPSMSPPMAPINRDIVPPRTRIALIVRWTLMEASAIFGLLAAFLARDPRLFVPLGALAVIGILASYPSENTLTAMNAQQ
jgi:hypothetical protein